MTTYRTDCVYSAVKNVSGQAMKFPFLPPHGVDLAAGEEVTVFGNILEAVNRGDRSGRKHMDSLESALNQGYLEIRNTPSPVFTDAVTDDVQVLATNNGTLGLADPCWEASFSV